MHFYASYNTGSLATAKISKFLLSCFFVEACHNKTCRPQSAVEQAGIGSPKCVKVSIQGIKIDFCMWKSFILKPTLLHSFYIVLLYIILCWCKCSFRFLNWVLDNYLTNTFRIYSFFLFCFHKATLFSFSTFLEVFPLFFILFYWYCLFLNYIFSSWHNIMTVL